MRYWKVESHFEKPGSESLGEVEVRGLLPRHSLEISSDLTWIKYIYTYGYIIQVVRNLNVRPDLNGLLTSIYLQNGSKSAIPSEQYVKSVTNSNLSSNGIKIRHLLWTICWIGFWQAGNQVRANVQGAAHKFTHTTVTKIGDSTSTKIRTTNKLGEPTKSEDKINKKMVS